MTKPLYFYNGTTFELVGPTTPQSPIAYQTSAPTAPATGDLWIDSDGDVDTYNRQLTRYYFVATAGQTSVSGVDANGLTLAYVAGSEMVHVNGSLLVRGQDYTATDGTSITGLSALGLNDVVEVFAYTAFTVANAYTKTETDSVAAAAPGLRMVVPTSVSVGSGSGSVDAIGNVTFSGASSVSLNGCFTSTYDNYRILINLTAITVDGSSNIKLRASGTDAATGYNYNGLQVSASTATGDSQTAQTSFPVMQMDSAASGAYHLYTADLFNPFEAIQTGILFTSRSFTGAGSALFWNYGGYHGTSSSYDGFTLTLTGATTGSIKVYGYKGA